MIEETPHIVVKLSLLVKKTRSRLGGRDDKRLRSVEVLLSRCLRIKLRRPLCHPGFIPGSCSQ